MTRPTIDSPPVVPTGSVQDRYPELLWEDLDIGWLPGFKHGRDEDGDPLPCKCVDTEGSAT